jgi:prepilin signal peptidase PulO-like enzyme (type II secretory pathway)
MSTYELVIDLRVARAMSIHVPQELLLRADLFEQVLQQRYLGTKRFSLEGVTALLPLVDEILDAAGQRGAVELVMGMSHRGRLNVIVHVAKRPPEEVFAGFEDVDPRSVLGGGDVKLLTMIGALAGLEMGLKALLWTLIFGGCVGLTVLIWRIGAMTLVKRTGQLLVGVLTLGTVLSPPPEEQEKLKSPIFLGPCAAAALCVSPWFR